MQKKLSIKFGMTVSLTGSYAFQGKEVVQGIQLWGEEVDRGGGIFLREQDGCLPVQLILYDDKSRKSVARHMTERLIVNDKVDVLLGPYSSVLTLEVAEIAEKYYRVLWNHGGATDEIHRRGFRYIVSVPAPASQYFLRVLELVETIWPCARRVALVYNPKGTFSAEVTAGAEAYAIQRSFRLVAKVTYPASLGEVGTTLQEISSAEPDVLLAVGEFKDDIQLAGEVLRSGYTAVALVAAGLRKFGQALGGQADGFLGPSQWEADLREQQDIGPSSETFCQRYRQRYGSEPEYLAAQAFATGLVAQKCIAEAGNLNNYTLREIAGRLTFRTFYGPFRIDSTGKQVGHKVAVIQWRAGKKCLVWPGSAQARPFKLS